MTWEQRKCALAGVVDIVDDDRLSWLDVAKACQGHAPLRPHEADFVANMILLTAGGRKPSPKQARWLRDLFARLRPTA